MAINKKKDMEIKISADPQKAIADMAKIIGKQEAFINKLRESNREAKKGQKEIGGMGNAFVDVGRIAAGVFSAQALMSGFRKAFAFVKAEFEDLLRKEKEAAEIFKIFIPRFNVAISEWVGPEFIDPIFAKILKMSEDVKRSPELLQSIMSAYAGQEPLSTAAMGLNVTKMAAAISETTNVQALSAAVGALQKFIGKEKPIEDIFDITVGMRQQMGARAEELVTAIKGAQKLREQGVSEEDALALMWAGAQSQQGGRALGTLATNLPYLRGTEEKGYVQLVTREETKKKPYTPAELLSMKLQPMSYEDRINWFLRHPEEATALITPTTMASYLPLLKGGLFEKGREEISRFQTEDFYKQQLKAQEESALVGFAETQQETQALIDLQKFGFGAGAMRADIKETVKRVLESNPDVSLFGRKLILGQMEFEDRLTGELIDDIAIKRLEGLRERFSEEYIQRGMPITRETRGRTEIYSADLPNKYYSPETVDVINRLIDIIDKKGQVWDKMNEILDKLNNNIEQQNNQKNNVVLPALDHGVID